MRIIGCGRVKPPLTKKAYVSFYDLFKTTQRPTFYVVCVIAHLENGRKWLVECRGDWETSYLGYGKFNKYFCFYLSVVFKFKLKHDNNEIIVFSYGPMQYVLLSFILLT